jgi:hypothetical protein
MAHMSLTTFFPALLGAGNKRINPQLSEDQFPMFNFSHLFDSAKARGANNGDDTEIKFVDDEPVKVAKPAQHSREHNVAVSDEAKANPVLAIRLLKDTDLSSKKIKAKLASAPQALSKFTQNFMEENDPTWEFQSDEEKARTALMFSSQNSDKNGYSAANISATKALKKMEEPLTDDELKALVEHTTQLRNDYDPNSPDNVNARRQADEDYKQEVAQAMARRNDRLRATGKMLPGDAKRVNGKVEGPAGEIDRLKSQISL